MRNYATFAAALFLGAAAVVMAGDDRPNIVIILSDDSGYTDLGCYGGEIDTPNLDRLSKRGMRLSTFYTNGRCSPTRASMLSGLDSAHVGFGGGALGEWWREVTYPAHRGRLPYDTPLLPELLKEAGYHTMMAGKWHLGGSTMKDSKHQQNFWKQFHPGWELTGDEMEAEFRALPAQRGFDEYFGMFGAQDVFFITPGQPHPYMEGNRPAELTFDTTYSMHCYTNKHGARYGANHGKTSKAFYATDGVTDRAIEMIEQASGEGKPPFLMYVAYRAPHVPLQAPEELVQKYLPRYRDLRKAESDRAAGLAEKGMFPRDARWRKTWIPPGEEEDFSLQLAVHAAMMEKVDENVGRLVRALEKADASDNTLVLYLSDNGAASHIQGYMNAPYHGSKALVWEGGTKTHLLAVWPEKIKPGTLSRDQAWVADIFPTCLEVAGATYPETFRGAPTRPLDGRSMMPTLMGESTPAREVLFFNDKGQQSVIYQGRWKLLIDPGWYLQTQKVPGTAYELYDLENDPAETTNLADAKPELVKMLEKRCEVWKKACGIVDYAEILELRPRDPF